MAQDVISTPPVSYGKKIIALAYVAAVLPAPTGLKKQQHYKDISENPISISQVLQFHK